MSFRNQLLTVLRVVTPAGLTALLIRGGPNSNGQGQAVMQLSTGSADEANPAELTAISDGDAPGSNASLFLESPSKTSMGAAGRAYLQLFARTANQLSTSILGGDVTELAGDVIWLVPQNNSATSAQVNGSLQVTGVAALKAGVAVTGRTTTDQLTVQTGHTIALQANEAHGRATLTPSSFFTVRAGYSFFVTPLGSDMAFIYGQLVAKAATANGVLLTTLPAAFTPATTQTVPVGNNIAPASGQVPVAEVATDGTVKLWSATLAANGILDIFGVYCLT